MNKPHCDNCDELIIEAETRRRVTIQPLGFNCFVTLTVEKLAAGVSTLRHTELCARCLKAAAEEFARTFPT